MSKNKLRTVHVNETKWVYTVGEENVNIYSPGEKQILKRVEKSTLMQAGEETGIRPSMVKEYIEENLV